MRIYLQTMLLAFVPMAIAIAQVAPDPNNRAGGLPPQGQPGDLGPAGPRGLIGPPPNVMFSVIDADGDGVITKAELRRAVMQLKKLDADKDGNITLAEVSPPGGPRGLGGDPAQFIARVMANDKNRDGELTADEIPDDLKAMMQDADLNNDGVVTRDELNTIVATMQQRLPGGPGAGGWPNTPGGFRGPAGFGNRAVDPNQMTGQLLKNDQNGDGKLSADELPNNMRNMFRAADDQNGDGTLDAAELQAVIERMGDRARGMRGAFGADRNGERGRGRGDNNRARERSRDEN